MIRFVLHFFFRLYPVCILGLTALFPGTILSQGKVSVVHSSDDTLLISFRFPEPSFLKFAAGSEQNRTQFAVPMLFESVLILAQDESIDVQVVEKKVETVGMGSPFSLVEDIALGKDGEFIRSPGRLQSSGEIWEERCLGSVEGKNAFQIGITPHRFQGSDVRLQCIRELTLRIVGEGVELISDGPLRSKVFRSLIDEKNRVRGLQKSFYGQEVDGLSSSSQRPRLKILVSREGIFSLPRPMISAAGWDVTQLNPRFFTIVGSSGEIPIRVVGEEDGSFDLTDRVEFWGEPLWDIRKPNERRLDVFATQNVYWLELGETDGLRLAQEEGWSSDSKTQPVIHPRSFPFTQHEEKDDYFHRLPYATGVDEGDHWFTSSPIVGGEKREFSFDLYSPDVDAIQLVAIRVKLRGQSRSLAVHPVEIYLNDRQIASGNWQGNDALLLESQGFSPTYLQEGNNQLTVVNRSSEGALSQLFLDWFEITYPRLYQAQGDYLRFRAPAYSVGKVCCFEIEGFSRIPVEVYKKGVSRIYGSEVKAVTDSLGQTSYSVVFEDVVVDEETEYIALTPWSKSVPDDVVFVEETGLRSEEKGADYVVVVPPDSLWRFSLRSLINLRQSQGLKVEVVGLDAIYDEFHGGIPNPEAIRRFLRYAYHHWTPPPRFVLLVGDGVINNRAAADQGNLIPVYHYQTVKFGAAASDHFYALLDGEDHNPDVAIGRLPVRNRRELEAVVAKIVNYEKNSVGAWRNRYLLIGAGGHGDAFRSQSETLIQEVLPPSLRPERLYLSGSLSDPYVGGAEDLMRYFRDGVALVNFRGHGGGAIWADAGLLDLDDVELIENEGKLPVVTSMTCFTTDFASGRKSLGEALVCQEETGGVAFWGATGVGWLWNDYYLLRELYRVLAAEPDLTLGEMITRAKTSYLFTYGVGYLPLSEVYQHVLLGDPALRLVVPSEEISLTLAHRALSLDDSIRVEGVAEPENFDLVLEVTGHDRSAQDTHPFGFQQNHWEVTIPIPPDFADQEGGVRAYLWDSEVGYQARGFVPFTLGKTYFDSLRILPEHPSYRDTLRFSVVAEDPDGLQRVWCRMISPHPDSLEMVLANESGRYTTTQGVGPFSPGTVLVFAFLAENGEGSLVASDTVTFTLPTLPDLAVQSIALGGTDRVFLEAAIRNFGGEEVAAVSVRFECPQTAFVTEDTVCLAGYGDVVAAVPFSPIFGRMDFTVTVDPDTAILESDLENNLFQGEIDADRFNVTPEEGSYSGSSAPDTVGLPGRIFCFIPPGAVSKRTVIHFEVMKNNDGAYSGMGLRETDEMLRLSLLGLPDESTLSGEAILTFFVGPEDSLQSLKPYRWDGSIQRWALCPFVYSDSGMVVQTETLGFFRLLSSEDNEPPWIEIQVENQPFAEGSYVSREPHISVVIQDESGVDIRPGNVGIFLDGELQDLASITFPDSTEDPTNIAISFRPELEPGEHDISVKASDVHGNVRQTEKIRFQVSSHFEIQYLGHHPNPFNPLRDKETVFVYVLTDVARRISLKIYTVAGRLIRSFEDCNVTDYHEIRWDGRDEWGEEVANGVYFFRLRAEGSQDRREVTGKIAIMR